MRALTTLPLALLLACGDAAAPPEAATTSSTTVPTTSTSDTAAAPTTGTSDITTETSATPPVDFIASPDITFDLQCDIFAQDCRTGEKCVPWATDGLFWNATRCVPVTGDAAPGEPCTAPEGPVAGIDDCAAPAICWDLGPDDQGTCTAQCAGDRAHPICPPLHVCAQDNSLLALCLPACDPLADYSCPAAQVCIPVDHGFLCAVASNSGAINDPCEFVNNCDPGLACVPATAASSACDPRSAGCCQPYCELPDSPCPNPDQQCIPYFEPDQAPPQDLDVGICAIPS